MPLALGTTAVIGYHLYLEAACGTVDEEYLGTRIAWVHGEIICGRLTVSVVG